MEASMTRSLVLAATGAAVLSTAARAQEMIYYGPPAYVAAPPVYAAPAWVPAYPVYVASPVVARPPAYGPPHAVGYAAPYPVETYGLAAPIGKSSPCGAG